MNLNRLWMGTLAAAFAGAPAVAQAEPRTAQDQDRPSATPAVMGFAIYKVSDLIGADVQDASDADRGDVKDLLVDPDSGRAELAITEFDDLVDGEDRTVVLPLRFLRVVMDEDGKFDHVFLLADLQEVRTAPLYDEELCSNLPADGLEKWIKSVQTHFGELERETDLRDVKAAGGTVKRLVKASALLDMNVRGQKGDEIGEIDEMLIDPQAERLPYFVIGTGGFLGLGEKEYALPWGIVRCATDEEGNLRLTVPLTEESLKTAPEYDGEAWARMASPLWVREVYVFYRIEPYWSEAVEAGYPKKQ